MAVIDVPAGVAARVVEFSPFEKSKELLAIGCDNLLSVGTCEFEVCGGQTQRQTNRQTDS